ncbi:hypothetical protein Ait01nite_056660 [Actinoplanes italicus]|uniref:Uncharacterized protein DUF4352 n=1 Tax=Actinoplanes italicus TaxID=113567 RepID=A0A2T0K5Z8_9ACTN|nr:uncharacterized protein DUF4352 [Actinoplanes italicus]GIE32621.1 hypothetical protein Ait01nite_056660 [Actinoplanes italicus]
MSYEPPPPPPYQPPPPPHGYGYGPVPPQPAPPGWGPPAPVKQTGGNRTVLAVVGGVLALCCGGIGIAALSDDTPTTSTSTNAGDTVQETEGGAQGIQQQEKAPAEKPAKPVEADTFNVPAGSKITHQDGGSTVEAVMRSVKTYKKGCNSLDVDPENGLFVVVDVVVTQTKGKGSVNPLHFEFVAEDGTSANALSAVFSGCGEPSLASADLRAGQKRAGKIVFDVGMKAGALEWTPDGLPGEVAGSWAVK